MFPLNPTMELKLLHIAVATVILDIQFAKIQRVY